PFWQLHELDGAMRAGGAEPHAMGWIEFQVEVIRKLSAKSEANYPFDAVWIVPRGAGRVARLEAA
ncbi:MAG: rhizopine catabolism protein, partial [Pseudomonadota bacterium]